MGARTEARFALAVVAGALLAVLASTSWFARSAAGDSVAMEAATPGWNSVALPNIQQRPVQTNPVLLPTGPPYSILWPGEGQAQTGVNDPACSPPTPTPPNEPGRRARSDLLSGVTGIRFTGYFSKSGSAPEPEQGNHLAFFFHTPDKNSQPCYKGGAEYGFTRILNDVHDQNATLYFYECNECNRTDDPPGKMYKKFAVWSYPASLRTYQVEIVRDKSCIHDINQNGKLDEAGEPAGFEYQNFLISILNNGTRVQPPQLICRWPNMAQLSGAQGWITTNAHAGDPNADASCSPGQANCTPDPNGTLTVDRLDGSYLFIRSAEWLKG